MSGNIKLFYVVAMCFAFPKAENEPDALNDMRASLAGERIPRSETRGRKRKGVDKFDLRKWISENKCNLIYEVQELEEDRLLLLSSFCNCLFRYHIYAYIYNIYM